MKSNFSDRKRGERCFGMMAFYLLFLFILAGCGGEPKTEEAVAYDRGIAQLVSHVTTGVVSSGDAIVVRFVDPMVESNLVGVALSQPVFSFAPEIQGIATWKDRQTLVFSPNRRLSLRQSYSGSLHLKTLFPEWDGESELKLTFSVAGREVSEYAGDFVLLNPDDPKRLIYEGTLGFTEPIDLGAVKEAVTFWRSGRREDLDWKELKQGLRFAFRSGPLVRPDKRVPFVFQIDHRGLDLSQTVERTFALEPLKAFKVTDLLIQDQGKHPGVELVFSDVLDPGQDITGLIQVNPRVSLSHKVLGKSIHLSGEFIFGETYSLTVSGIRSKWGVKLSSPWQEQVDFEDRKPRIAFLSNGAFLPSSNERKIGFKTINVQRVRLQISKVFESNLGQFLQTEELRAHKQRNNAFNSYNVNRVGIQVVDKKLEIGDIKNRWLNHQLDLGDLLKKHETGLFLIAISFEKKDMLYSGLTKDRRYYYGRDYYSNPNSSGYLWRHGRIYKPIVLSDIGLTYKRGSEEHLVLAANIIDATPMKDVQVTLRSYQNQIIASGDTDGNGIALFTGVKETVFYVEAEKEGDRSVIKPGEMAWNLSSFEVGGDEVAPDETRTFIYTERGVYRPGDEINLSLIARNRFDTFPDAHPVTLSIYNPKNQLAYEKTSTDGKDGFYSFRFESKQDAPTGNWRAKFKVGAKAFYHTLKIETVAPYRLKVHIHPEKETLNYQDRRLRLSLESTYLFGNPASLLDAVVTATLKRRDFSSPKYPGFMFGNEALPFKSMQTQIFQGKLDENGRAAIDWQLPPLDEVPSAITAQVTAKVTEKGGRDSRNDVFLPVDPYPYYVGLQKPTFRWGYGQVGQPVKINVVLADAAGHTVSGRSLSYRIYRNARYWWWEYDTRDNFRVRYKRDTYTKIVKSGELSTKSIPAPIEFTPEGTGEYLIEVSEEVHGGHTAAFFFSAYYWGDSPTADDNAGALILKTNKKTYHPGERAMVSFPAPSDALVFVSVEKAHRILSSRVQRADAENENQTIEIPVDHDMLPNAYVSVSVLQPHRQTLNDRPIRMYGVVPLHVVDPGTNRRISISMPDELRSDDEFRVGIQTEDNQPAQFTIAVVDEGLLDITRFPTPDPWGHFFKKQRLAVQSYDLYSLIIGANKGDLFRLFSIGGDMEEGYRGSQLEPQKKRRFPAVSMFRGPFRTDDKGHAELKFQMPNYIGSVRVMVVAARGRSYGQAQKTVPVKTELVVLPTLPRVMGPEDQFSLPVTVFALQENIRKVDVSVRVEGPVSLVGEAVKTVVFDKPGERDVLFDLQAKAAVGDASVTVVAQSGRFRTSQTTDLMVRPYSPRIYATETYECLPGKKLLVDIPSRGIPGTNRAVVSVMRRDKLNFEHRLYWLIHYPYGCIEQTVSSVFPQLYLKEFMKKSRDTERAIDDNINSAIDRLRRFQTPSGGFSFWPGGREISVWGTNYAGHFLVEAAKVGYSVPDDLLKGWSRFQKSQSLMTRDGLLVKLYRLYTLALAGEAQMGPMNLIKENSFNEMTHTEKWLLAAAYFLAGKAKVAEQITRQAHIDVAVDSIRDDSYGSWLRDKAIILEVTTLLEDWNLADKIYEEVVQELAAETWYSTQSLGYALLSLGKYIEANRGDFREEKSLMSGSIKSPGKKRVPFKTEALKFTYPITDEFGQKVEIKIAEETNLRRVFVTVAWDGVPLKPDVKEESRNLQLAVEWLDENGMPINPAVIRQGKTFWGHFRVGRSTLQRRRLQALALVQILPSGWEIENVRLLDEELPGWMRQWNLNREEYLDIRDDRVMWFFDLPPGDKTYDFVVKLSAVTVGEFILPPTLFEAMYDNNYKAIQPGMDVRVTQR